MDTKVKCPLRCGRTVSGGTVMDSFRIADKTFTSRLIVGTGKYSSNAVMVKAHEASGAEMITVAVRRVNISDRSKESLLDYIDASKYFLFQIPPAVTQPTRRFGQPGSAAKRDCRIG